MFLLEEYYPTGRISRVSQIIVESVRNRLDFRQEECGLLSRTAAGNLSS